MSREPGRWLVVAALILAMSLFTSGTAQAAWSATAGGPARATAVLMPAGQPPTVTRTALKTITVVIPRPVLSGSVRISVFNVYRFALLGTPTLVTLSGCTEQPTTRNASTRFRFPQLPRHTRTPPSPDTATSG